MTQSIGPEGAAILTLALVNDLFDLLREKGVLTDTEIVTLLESTAERLSKDPRLFAKSNVGYIRDTLIPKHEVK